MPKSCVAPGCTNHNKMGKEITFHMFPIDKERRSRWIQACKRINADGSKWDPQSKYTYICSEHFLNKKPSKDSNSPDFVPTVFEHNSAVLTGSKRKSTLERYERVTKKKRKDESTTSTADVDYTTTTADSTVTTNNDAMTADDTYLFPEDVFDDTAIVPAAQQPYQSVGVQVDEKTLVEEMNNLSIKILKTERTHLLTKISCLEQQAAFTSFSPEIVCENDEASIYLTGLSWKTFEILLQYLAPYVVQPRRNIAVVNQIMMVLVRLRLGIPLEYLSFQTGVAINTVTVTFHKIIDLCYAKLRYLIKPSDRDYILQTLPPAFKAEFPKLTSIIDCFEIFIDRPKNLKARAQVYSNYKKHSTVKFLICICPLGAVTFVSDAWGGRTTDLKISRESGFISQKIHCPGDQILADRGFLLHDDFAAACSAELIIPAFTKGKSQLSSKEVEETRKIANVRIHVERVIGYVKNRYKILNGPMPITMIKSVTNEVCDEVPSIEKLVKVCCSLINLAPGIVYSEFEKSDKEKK